MLKAKKLQPMVGEIEDIPRGYREFVSRLKKKIVSSRLRAAIAVNEELILLYWDLGSQIKSHQMDEGWGSKVIDRLSMDLTRAFSDMKGFSVRNLKYMLAFAKAYPDRLFVQQAAAQIPWFHNCAIIEKVKSSSARIFYVKKTIENSWSRDILTHQIEIGLHERAGSALTNFTRTLPDPRSGLAQQIVKDPYSFEFLGITDKISERRLEESLLGHLKEFLLEVGGQDYYIDLLFYHLVLRCYVIVDLKISSFIPEYAGKMNFYLSAVDDILRQKNDNSSIGIILCKTRNKVIVEYALRHASRPIGVASYRFQSSLPITLKGKLPSAEDLSNELKSVR
jgi:predicted nuclease of restriction endonuclease-like (RecB) superfamily